MLFFLSLLSINLYIDMILATPTSKMPRILLIEDDENLSRVVTSLLSQEGYRVTHVTNGDKGLETGLDQDFDVVLADIHMPGISGLDLLHGLQAAKPYMPVITFTGQGDLNLARESTRRGSFDHLMKPFTSFDLLQSLKRAVNSRKKNPRIQKQRSWRSSILGNSKQIKEVLKQIAQIATDSSHALILGERGTGKNLIAKTIVQNSDRTHQPFFVVHCEQMDAHTLETLLFGHEKGDACQADTCRVGIFEQAHLGTVVLDEVHALTSSMQNRILQVVTEKSVCRLGSGKNAPADVRILATSSLPLDGFVQEKKFRNDLFYHLSGTIIRVPSLRERREDILILIQHFLKQFSSEMNIANPSIDPQALAFLCEQNWPQNITQLANNLRTALMHAMGNPIGLKTVQEISESSADEEINLDAIKAFVAEYIYTAAHQGRSQILETLLQAIEREAMLQAYHCTGGDGEAMTRLLGISLQGLGEKLHQYHLGASQQQLPEMMSYC